MNTFIPNNRSAGAQITKIVFIVALLLSLVLMSGYARTTLAAPNATITVTNLNDSGAGSLRQAIADASAGDTIDFSVSGTITLASQLVIDKDLTIDGGGNITVSGGNAVRVFNVTDGNVTFNGLTISGGKATDCSNIVLTTCGGGILVEGSTSNAAVTIVNSTLTGNSTASAFIQYGGAIHNREGTLTIETSTIFDNTTPQEGGGISTSGGTVTIDTSTISGNDASGGGGIFNSGGTVNVSNSTITNNTTTSSDGGCGILSFGSPAVTNLKNTIVSGNSCSSGEDATESNGGTFTSNSYNLIGTTNSSAFTQTGDQTGVTDPMLDPLADNGGPTQTHALQTGSPAIDTIPDGTNGCSSGVSQDQRYAVRADGANRGGTACEIGAYEYDSNQKPNAITLQSFSANTAMPAIWLFTALLAGFATLVGVVVLRKRSL